MRPFAESVLQGNNSKVLGSNAEWISTPVRSDVEAKLRQLLIKLGEDDRILGIQVCAYKDGEIIIDTIAGVLGRYDPRPVQPDSLFPVFSVTKGITAGMLHWLVDVGKLKLEENVANIWSGFEANGKTLIKVHHVLNHTSGLHNAMADITKEDPLLMCDWEECLNRISIATPENEPGHMQLYHYLSFGWLCGGIIEHASGKKFQEVLNEAIIHPLNVEGELYIGIPPGVESRLATLTVDTEDLKMLREIGNLSHLPSSFQPEQISQMVSVLPMLFNTLNIRRAIIPAANGHCSARALARYYATLAAGGIVPPPSTSSEPALGSHPHTPNVPSLHPKRKSCKNKAASVASDKTNGNIAGSVNLTCSKDGGPNYSQLATNPNNTDNQENKINNRIFQNPKIHDAFMGVGDYENMIFPDGTYGLGFKRFSSKIGPQTSFGHSGLGGSTGFCDIEHKFAIAVTVNKMSLGGVTRQIIQLVCSELNVPVPEEFTRFGGGSNMQLNLDELIIN